MTSRNKLTGGAFIALFAVLFLPSIGKAGSITEYVQKQPGAPVQISICKAGIQFFSNRYGTNTSSLATGADFVNTSPKEAIEVVFRMRLSNALGTVMDNLIEQSTGHFAPGATIRGNTWSQTDAWPGLGEVQCSVARVLFSDGTDWRAAADSSDDAASSPAPSPTSSPVP